jgi:hypothetical protein
MKLQAEVGHYSSVVGLSVHLIGPKGNMAGQVIFMCHDDTLRERAMQERLAKVIAAAINKEMEGGE